jgi:hypothetical protein
MKGSSSNDARSDSYSFLLIVMSSFADWSLALVLSERQGGRPRLRYQQIR